MKNLVQLAVRSCQSAVLLLALGCCIADVQAQTFTSLEEALQKPKSAKTLDLSKQSLILFPKEILQLRKLKTLELNHNPLNQLPEGICELKSLQFLEISGTAIKALPGCMVEMKKLKQVIAFVDHDLAFPPELADKVVQMEKELRDLKPRPLDDSVFAEKLPKALNMRAVQSLIGYPEEARKKKIEGQIVFRVFVDKEGNYVRHTIVKQAHPLLQQAVEAHLDKLKFSPAMQNGKPIMFWVNIPFTFSR